MRNRFTEGENDCLSNIHFKLSSSPANPTFDMAFNPKLQDNFLLSPKTIPTFGIRIQSLREDLEIDPYEIENIRILQIPILGYDGTNYFV